MNIKFPLLENHPDLVYLDAAATALKPACVLEAEKNYGTQFGTNATRGLYPLAEATSQAVTSTRETVAQFIGVKPDEIIFTASTTAGTNMLATAFDHTFSFESARILVTGDAHHSQILPWGELASRNAWEFTIIPTTENGFIDTDAVLEALTPETKIIALTLVSNVYGVINELASLVTGIRAKNPDAFIVIDAAQAISHVPLDVRALGVDALVFSGHKLYGPTGIGVCYLKTDWQERLMPASFGGGMVLDTSTTPLVWKKGPEKFEAGTLPLSQIFGLRAAVELIQNIGFEEIQKHERALVTYTLQKLNDAFGNDIHILGTQDATDKIGLISFTLAGTHPHDIASLLGEENICVRAGEHCASFLHRSLALPATTRISFGIYTRQEDIDTLVTALLQIQKRLKK